MSSRAATRERMNKSTQRAHTHTHTHWQARRCDSRLLAERGGTTPRTHVLQSHVHTINSLANQVTLLKKKNFSWLLPGYTVNGGKPDRFYLRHPGVIYLNMLCRHFSAISVLYVWLPLPPPSPSYCILSQPTQRAPPPPSCSHHPLGERSNQRETNWNPNPDAGLTK